MRSLEHIMVTKYISEYFVQNFREDISKTNGKMYLDF